jgi:ATP-binding cassette subfamily C (CFTR/MRP) protein 1
MVQANSSLLCLRLLTRLSRPFPRSQVAPPLLSVEHGPELPDTSASFFSRITFQWIQPLISLGYHQQLKPSDLWTLDEPRTAHVLSEALIENFRSRQRKAEAWNARLDSGDFKPSFFRRAWWKVRPMGRSDGRQDASLTWALSDTFFWRFWTAGIIKLVADILQTTAPLVSKRIIDLAPKHTKPTAGYRTSPCLTSAKAPDL